MSADYGRTVGSATNVIVKSGTNRFHGDFLYSRTEEDWNEEFDSHPELADKQFCRGQEAGVVPLQCEADFFLRTDIEKASSDDQYETGLGGPLKRDKVWFFLSANRQNSNRTGKTKNGDAVDESGTLESRIIKLNFQAGASNSIAVNYIDTPVFRNFRLEPVYDRYAMTPHDISGELYSLSRNWSASNSVFVEFKAASQTSNEDKLLAFGGSSHGSVFNNTNDSYGENLEQVLLPADIVNCQARQANRTVPVNCAADWTQQLGTPISLINRDGHPSFDHSVIAKATGWKIFNITNSQTFTLGGHLTWNTGSKWQRSEGAGGSQIDPLTFGVPASFGSGVTIGERGGRELDSYWWLNLSGAYGFPLGDRLTGEVRLEIQIVTDQQDQVGITGTGEVQALRRGFPRPRRYRVLGSVKF